MSLIQSLDPTGNFLLERWPRRGSAAASAEAEIVVEQGELGVWLGAERTDRVLGPGHHVLPPSAGSGIVVFLRPESPVEFLWGTSEPIEVERRRFKAHGRLRVGIADPRQAARALAWERALANQDEVSGFLRLLVLERLKSALDELPEATVDLQSRLAASVSGRLAADLAAHGLALDSFAILALRLA